MRLGLSYSAYHDPPYSIRQAPTNVLLNHELQLRTDVLNSNLAAECYSDKHDSNDTRQ